MTVNNMFGGIKFRKGIDCITSPLLQLSLVQLDNWPRVSEITSTLLEPLQKNDHAYKFFGVFRAALLIVIVFSVKMCHINWSQFRIYKTAV